jgi:hypothetical protein
VVPARTPGGRPAASIQPGRLIRAPWHPPAAPPAAPGNPRAAGN